MWRRLILLIILSIVNSVALATDSLLLQQHKLLTESMSYYQKISRSIYTIYSIAKDKETNVALGSAVAVTRNLLVTNCHVVFAGNFIVLKINDSPYLARVCYFNQQNDLCIVDVSGVSLEPVKMRLSNEVKVGEIVYAVGNPEGHEKKMSKGEVISKVYKDGTFYLITNAPLAHGSSGGGLFDEQANLVGITTGGTPENGTGYAIPTELIIEIIEPHYQPVCEN